MWIIIDHGSASLMKTYQFSFREEQSQVFLKLPFKYVSIPLWNLPAVPTNTKQQLENIQISGY